MIADLIPKLAEFEREEDHEYYPRPSCSGPERCIRQMVYWGLKIPKAPLPGRTLLVFDDGNWHEELTKDWLRKSAYQVHSEQLDISVSGSLYSNMGIVLTGHIDWIMTDPLGVDILVEHKAINHFTWQKFSDGDELPLDYLHQMGIYFRGIQNINPDVKTGLLLIKNKNTAQYLEMAITYDQATDTLTVVSVTTSTGETHEINKEFVGINRASFDKFAEVNRLIKAKELPKRQYDIDHWRCSYCQWAGECYKNYDAEFQAMAVDQELAEEWETKAGYYKQLSGEINSRKKELDELKDRIVKEMKDANVRGGKTASWMLEIKQVHREGYIAPASDYEQLKISKIKTETKGKKNGK